MDCLTPPIFKLLIVNGYEEEWTIGLERKRKRKKIYFQKVPRYSTSFHLNVRLNGLSFFFSFFFYYYDNKLNGERQTANGYCWWLFWNWSGKIPLCYYVYSTWHCFRTKFFFFFHFFLYFLFVYFSFSHYFSLSTIRKHLSLCIFWFALLFLLLIPFFPVPVRVLISNFRIRTVVVYCSVPVLLIVCYTFWICVCVFFFSSFQTVIHTVVVISRFFSSSF